MVGGEIEGSSLVFAGGIFLLRELWDVISDASDFFFLFWSRVQGGVGLVDVLLREEGRGCGFAGMGS